MKGEIEPAPDRSLLLMIGCGGVVLVAVVAGMLAALLILRKSLSHDAPPTANTTADQPATVAQGGKHKKHADDAPSPDVASPQPKHTTKKPEPEPEPTATPAPEPTVGFNGDLGLTVPVRATDLTTLDLVTLYGEARAVALRLQPGAKFMSLVAFDLTDGVIDLTSEMRAVFTFEFVGTIEGAPPGKDVVQRTIRINAEHGKLVGTRSEHGVTTLKLNGGKFLHDPTCTSKAAWAAAVKSGVPKDAVVTLHFYDNRAFSPASPDVWSFRVNGHDEYRREVDGKTCAIVK